MKNWVAHQTPRLRRTQPFSFFCLGVLLALQANAQVQTPPTTLELPSQTDPRQPLDNFERSQNLPKNNYYPYVRKKRNSQRSSWDEIKENLHGSYFVSLMGPSLLGNGNSTYNIYFQDTAPIQLFHGAQLSYKVNQDLELGISASVVQPLVNGIVGRTGLVYNDQLSWFDPVLFANFPHLFYVPGWSIFSSVTLALCVTKSSIDENKITALELSQSWSPVWKDTPWGLSLNWYINPRFFAVQVPPTLSSRQTFTAVVGHQLTYQVSPKVNFAWTTNFDFDHREPDPNGFLHFSPNLPDYSRFSMNLAPDVKPLFMSLGFYFQVITFKPNADTSIIGGSFSIGF